MTAKRYSACMRKLRNTYTTGIGIANRASVRAPGESSPVRPGKSPVSTATVVAPTALSRPARISAFVASAGRIPGLRPEKFEID